MSELDDEGLMLARGRYSTIRAKHEDEKKRLSILCGQLSSSASQVLRYMQPDGDVAPAIDAVLDMLSIARETLTKIDACVENIEALAMQRAALKQAAWGGK